MPTHMPTLWVHSCPIKATLPPNLEWLLCTDPTYFSWISTKARGGDSFSVILIMCYPLISENCRRKESMNVIEQTCIVPQRMGPLNYREGLSK